MSSKKVKKVIDTYYMVRNRWGNYLAETRGGLFSAHRTIAERYLTDTGAKNAIERAVESWQQRGMFSSGATIASEVGLKVVKVTVRQ